MSVLESRDELSRHLARLVVNANRGLRRETLLERQTRELATALVAAGCLAEAVSGQDGEYRIRMTGIPNGMTVNLPAGPTAMDQVVRTYAEAPESPACERARQALKELLPMLNKSRPFFDQLVEQTYDWLALGEVSVEELQETT